MKLAIHNGKDKPVSWNTRWMDYCKKNSIPYIEVDCYAFDIIETLRKECVTHLMWAFSLAFPKDHIVSKCVLNAAELMGIKVFPNFESNWHFEDKVAQKYLLEAVGAPVVQSWTFFDKSRAIDFLNNAQYPIVAKLRKGAGSKNVILLHDAKEAQKYIRRMFDGGGVIPVQSSATVSKQRTKAFPNKDKRIIRMGECFRKFMKYNQRRKLFTKEVGYVYFQEFLPNNINDLRIAVVGNRIWGFYRGVRKNDFRASGSGIIDYNTQIPLDVVRNSYQITKTLGTQSLCFDYVKAPDGQYKIVEVCYGYVSEAIYKCNGFWDDNLEFHESHLMPDECILEDFINS